MNALNVAVFIILIAIVVHKHSNVVVYGANIPNSIRSYNNNYKNLNAKAMEDALEHVGISPQVSSSLINGNSNSSDNWGGNMGPSTSKGARVSSKQLFNGLACLLVTSLCLLLLELRQPGIAHRTAKRLYHNTFVATTTVSLNETPVAQSNYSPVPAPFLVPPKARFNSRDYASPTSEPTVLIGIHFS